MKIAIIGTGISGLGAAYLLAPHHDITLYEENGYIGGHSRTIDIDMGAQTLPVDTGFIVFNKRNYPLLTGLFDHINLPYEKSDMSFGVSIHNGWLEYGSKGMFAQKRNLIRPAYLQMLADILKFNRRAMDYCDPKSTLTLGALLDKLHMGPWFRHYYLLPMGAAIWSCPVATMLKFPAYSFLQFFNNHGLLTVNDHPKWYTVTGGSREYIKRLTASFTDKIRLNSGVKSLNLQKGTSQKNKIEVADQTGGKSIYDQIIFACPANKALEILAASKGLTTPSAYQNILGCFSYQPNKIIVHGDSSFMPKTKKCWASWVYLSSGKSDDSPDISLSYWMNNLQNLKDKPPIFITLNPDRRPDESLIYDEHSFAHPVFDGPAIKAQSMMSKIQGQNGLWFCGAHLRNGFHEDGLDSAVKVARALGANLPWL